VTRYAIGCTSNLCIAVLITEHVGGTHIPLYVQSVIHCHIFGWDSNDSCCFCSVVATLKAIKQSEVNVNGHNVMFQHAIARHLQLRGSLFVESVSRPTQFVKIT
jgi:hypothetical protein